ncbi:MAG: hypothetical protein IPK81_20380 [Rhodospirillales bacterium]|nr:MAG: hypothetical protein IPK81_20380 [Rhodospirillales bacterium]
MNVIDAQGLQWIAFAIAVPVLCYFMGICIWSKTLRKDTDPTLRQQLALGVAGVFVVVFPLLVGLSPTIEALFRKSAEGDPTVWRSAMISYLVSLGIYVQQGLVVHEVVRRKIADAMHGTPSAVDRGAVGTRSEDDTTGPGR